MRKVLSVGSSIILALLLFTAQVNMSSCTKDTVTTDTVKTTISDTTKTIINDTTDVITYPIQGLWVGTAINTTPNTNTTPYFFSFSVLPDGTLTYKSIGTNNYTYYAAGTWALNGTIFTFSVVTINNYGGTQDTQTGTATYNSATGTLTDGNISDITSGATATWTMNKVN